MCFQRMRSYLLGRSIIICSDYCPLCNMMNSAAKNRIVDRIFILLQEFNIEKVIHIRGQHNCLADYLSRHPIPKEEEIFDEDYGIGKRDKRELTGKGRVPDETPPSAGIMVTRSKTKELQSKPDQNTTTVIPSQKNKAPSSTIERKTDQRKYIPSQESQKYGFCMEKLKVEQAKDPIIQVKIAEVKKNPVKCSYELKDGLLYKLLMMHGNCNTQQKLISLPSSMINDLLQVYHSDPLSDHFGVQRTYLKIKNKYWWPDMKQSIMQYI